MSIRKLKHAYLIMAHENIEQLQYLIGLLDHEQNDIFIHIDLKVNISEIIFKTKYSSIYVSQEYDISWGTYDQVQCELYLLNKASRRGYDYYHLLSGSDMPVKKISTIIDFFEEHNGKEFIDINMSTENYSPEIKRRTRYYHFFTKLRHSHRVKLYNDIFAIIDRVFIGLQIIFRINRDVYYSFKPYFGSNWFSITDRCAAFVLANESYVRKRFKWVNSCDEIFLQTLIVNSPFLANCYKADGKYCNLRYIEWNQTNGNAHPDIIDLSEWKRAVNSGCLFARKFDLYKYKDVKIAIDNYFQKNNLE